jgi:hypothetical protein
MRILLIIVCALLAQAETAGNTEPGFTVFSLAGQRGGELEYADSLAPFKALLKKLPYRRYRLLAVQEMTAPAGRETTLPLAGGYSLHLQPEAQRETGETALTARLTRKENGSETDILTGEGLAAPDEPLVLHGMPLGREQLAVLLMLTREEDSGTSSREEEAQDGDSEEKEEEDNESDSEEEEENQENRPEAGETEEEQEDGQKAEGGEPETEHIPENGAPQLEPEPEKDMEHIEALLESLEEMDKREQQQQKQQHERVQIESDWW